jgi:NCAIR mutase (PurE)-related protein
VLVVNIDNGFGAGVAAARIVRSVRGGNDDRKGQR